MFYDLLLVFSRFFKFSLRGQGVRSKFGITYRYSNMEHISVTHIIVAGLRSQIIKSVTDNKIVTDSKISHRAQIQSQGHKQTRGLRES